jgi:CubicO group peptidase (beta-lactamase class C family)
MAKHIILNNSCLNLLVLFLMIFLLSKTNRMKTKNLTFFLLVFLFSTLGALAQSGLNPNLGPEFDRLLSERYQPGQPGVAALVARDGQVIYRKAFGMANLELDVPMTPDMVFRIGSITKQFTAVAVLQLLEQGKLGLDDEITRFIPDYPTQGHKITIHHLLNHTSGIKSYTSMSEFSMVMRKDHSPSQIIDIFKDEPMDFAPGERFLYNNSGYILLGYIIEKITGKTYQEYVTDHLFSPAGMEHSLYGSENIVLKNRAYGYQPSNNGYANADFLSLSLPYAAGSLMSTVDDLFKWNQALQSGKLLKKETLELAFTPGKLNDGTQMTYGYGWDMGNLQGSPVIAHGGGIHGFISYAIWLPQENVVVVLLQNRTGSAPEDLAHQMAAMTIGKPFDFKEITVAESTLQEFAGVFENKDGVKRAIFLDDGKLFSQRFGATQFQIIPFASDKFFFENSLTQIEFKRDAQGKVVAAIFKTATGLPEEMKLTNEPLPEKTREIQLPEEILKRYVGRYELMPGFELTFTLEEGKLMTQATGQPKFEIFAESDTKFFLKVTEASVEFLLDESGKVNALILRQSGQEIRAPKLD